MPKYPLRRHGGLRVRIYEKKKKKYLEERDSQVIRTREEVEPTTTVSYCIWWWYGVPRSRKSRETRIISAVSGPSDVHTIYQNATTHNAPRKRLANSPPPIPPDRSRRARFPSRFRPEPLKSSRILRVSYSPVYCIDFTSFIKQ